jgi:hypothetical protein
VGVIVFNFKCVLVLLKLRKWVPISATLFLLAVSNHQHVGVECRATENAAAAQVAQGVRRQLEADGVQVSFIWTKGHLDKFESTKDMMCASCQTSGHSHQQEDQTSAAKRARCC